MQNAFNIECNWGRPIWLDWYLNRTLISKFLDSAEVLFVASEWNAYYGPMWSLHLSGLFRKSISCWNWFVYFSGFTAVPQFACYLLSQKQFRFCIIFLYSASGFGCPNVGCYQTDHHCRRIQETVSMPLHRTASDKVLTGISFMLQEKRQ